VLISLEALVSLLGLFLFLSVQTKVLPVELPVGQKKALYN
jgi:hypothetical protein